MIYTLKQARMRAYLSTRELAEQADVAQATLWRIETGKHIPRFGTMRKLAQVLGVHPSEIREFAIVLDEGHANDTAQAAQSPEATV